MIETVVIHASCTPFSIMSHRAIMQQPHPWSTKTINPAATTMKTEPPKSVNANIQVAAMIGTISPLRQFKRASRPFAMPLTGREELEIV
jgi:hypothetical protein